MRCARPSASQAEPNVALGPDGGEHGFRNVADGELRVVNVHAPNTGFGRRMRED